MFRVEVEEVALSDAFSRVRVFLTKNKIKPNARPKKSTSQTLLNYSNHFSISLYYFVRKAVQNFKSNPAIKFFLKTVFSHNLFSGGVKGRSSYLTLGIFYVRARECFHDLHAI